MLEAKLRSRLKHIIDHFEEVTLLYVPVKPGFSDTSGFVTSCVALS